MRRLLLAVPLAALSVVGWPTTHALAQDTKTSRGTLTAMGADSVTVKVGMADMKFMVDAKTTVEAPGASTKTRQAAAAQKAAPKLGELLKVGDAVEVSYSDMAGSLHAAKIRKEEALIDWRQSAVQIERQVRAFNPWPEAETTLGAKRVRIWRARALPAVAAPGSAAPGSLMAGPDAAVCVACGAGVLAIQELQLPGKRVINARDFAHSRPLAGLRFGAPSA